MFGKAKQATLKYEIESEREVISQNILEYQMEIMTENSTTSIKKMGTTLIDRKMDNRDIWNIIIQKSSNKTYGTGWNYIEKGTVIKGYGKTKYNWVANYETGETIFLEEKSYNYLDSSSTVAVKDDLVFSFDSAALDTSEGSLGQNARLYYYDITKYSTDDDRKKAYEKEKENTVENVEEGYDRTETIDTKNYIDTKSNAFKFNGDNYIEIYDESGFDFSNGFTYEFFGNIKGVQFAFDPTGANYCGLFGLWNGSYKEHPFIRFGIYLDTNTFGYNLIKPAFLKDELKNEIKDSKQYGSWSDEEKPWNQRYELNSDITNQDLFFTVTFAPKTDSTPPTQTIYLNGEELASGFLGEKYYSNFVNESKNLHYFEIGRCSAGSPRSLVVC